MAIYLRIWMWKLRSYALRTRNFRILYDQKYLLRPNGCEIVFAAIHATDVSQALMLECAREFSPCVESTAPGIVLLDLHGTERLLGPSQDVGKQIHLRAQDLGFILHVAVAA